MKNGTVKGLKLDERREDPKYNTQLSFETSQSSHIKGAMASWRGEGGGLKKSNVLKPDATNFEGVFIYSRGGKERRVEIVRIRIGRERY